ncbi:MAG: hypothetical protein J0I34_30885 [Pseudonocardia sp.]|uniref:hypothetical protein n=1 Tax=unclassified Pseudonocardia TaxID=2619320 RepID=UPI00086E6315|nr:MULTISPECIES: hypothetical protein [unclassified Pseudonocardia]MBN9113178.1 hypothetical protein [Pseudonocardia sp.]ODU24272.1 MAG: hypothetical protein ABS80_12935 [Pseudonocardia sp. SCN 72-51]ODV01730.1 MAG: hypothetical protein ABT15_26775 [Pseudonocardia sp. SCN 73-27]
MSTTSRYYEHDDNDADGRDVDERPAVRQAEAGAQAWRAVVHAQGSADPEHADFYAIAGELVDTLAAVAALAEVLARQVEQYGEGRPVYDDSRVVDPHELLYAAAADMHELAVRAREADRVVNTFWSRISHIGVDNTTQQAAEVADGGPVAVTR